MSYKSNNKIRHPPVQQQSPFSTGQYTAQAQTQQSPETIMIECNRQNALYKGAGEAGLDSQNNTWVSEFQSGIQLRTGDEVKVHSAFLSSIGVGDLISWDTAEGSKTQDNKGTWIYSFYGANDAKNDKREQYNMKYGKGIFPWDVDNRPSQLYRNLPNGLDTTANFPDRPNSNSNTYYQDPYCPARILNEVPKTQANIIGKEQIPLVDGNFRISFVNNPVVGEGFDPIGQSIILIDQYDGTDGGTPPTPVYDAYDVRKIFSIGKTYKFYPLELDVDAKTAPATGHWNYNGGVGFIFTIYGFVDLVNEPLYGGWGAIMENQFYDKGLYYDGVGGNNDVKHALSTGYFQEVNIGGNNSYNSASNPQVPKNKPLATTFSSFNQISKVGDEVFMVYTPTINQATPQTPTEGAVLYEENELVLFQITESPNENIVLDVLFKELFNPANDLDHSYITVEFLNPPTPLNTKADLLALNDGLNTFGFYLNGITLGYEFMTASTLGNTTWISLNTFTLTNVLRSVNAPDGAVNYNPNQKGNCILYGMLNNNGFTYRHKGNRNQSITNSIPQLTVPANGTKDLYTMINTQVLIDNFGSLDNVPLDMGYETLAYQVPIGEVRSTAFASVIAGTYTIDLTNYSQTINGVDEFIAINKFYKHYSTYTFSIDEDYSSPSDIATSLTKQTHKPTSPRDILGNILPTSVIGSRLDAGIPQNNFLLPVFTSDVNDDNVKNEETQDQTPDMGLGLLGVGSFKLVANIYNLELSTYKDGATEVGAVDNGKYDIYFRTQYTTFNKPIDYSDKDFDQKTSPSFAVAHDTTATSPIIGYPINYISGQKCYVSQYVGTDNISFNWDTTNSRFTFSYLHQPIVSTFASNETNGTESGGVESAIIYFPEPKGVDDYLYKLPQTRNGGINIENWLSNEIPYGMSPKAIRELNGLDDSVDLSTDWFIGANTKNISQLSKRFWTKLGFDETQFNNVGYDVEPTSNNITPKATTDGLIDVADGVISLEQPAEDTPWFYTNRAGAQANPPLQTEYQSSLGALNCGGHAKGYGLANTSGTPAVYYPNATGQTGAISKEDQMKSTYNPDRERHRAFTTASTSTELIAKNLPTKTENGYFLIMSDIVETEFYISANKGGNTNCVGIISKLNAEGDFYYQYQAPQSFYIKKDKLITSITIDIRKPDLTTPNAISPYSSILFQITRYQPVPQSIPQPLWTQQQEFYANLNNSLQQIIQQNKPVKNTPQRTRLAEIMNQVSSAILQTQTEETEPDLVQRIINNYDRMNLTQFKNDPRGLRQFLLANPEASGFLDDINTIQAPAPTIPTDPEELTEEGLFNYVSQYQPVISGGGFGADEPPPFLPEADPTVDTKTPAEIMRFIINNQKERLLNDQRPLGADDIASMLGAGATPARIESIMSLGEKMEKNMIESKTGEREARAMDLTEREEEMRLRKVDQYKDYRERGGVGQFAGEKKEGLDLQDRLSRQAGRPPADRPSYYIKPPDYQESDDEER